MSTSTSVHCEGFDQESFEKLLHNHASVFSSNPGSCDMTKMAIKILSDSEIVSQKPYSIPQSLKYKVEKEIQCLLEQGIIEPSDSPWASPVVPVVKPNGDVRMCIDFRQLNAIMPQAWE